MNLISFFVSTALWNAVIAAQTNRCQKEFGIAAFGVVAVQSVLILLTAARLRVLAVSVFATCIATTTFLYAHCNLLVPAQHICMLCLIFVVFIVEMQEPARQTVSSVLFRVWNDIWRRDEHPTRPARSVHPFHPNQGTRLELATTATRRPEPSQASTPRGESSSASQQASPGERDDRVPDKLWFPEEDENECCICLEKLASADIEALPCAHVFHSHCITRWFSESDSCPLCNLPISMHA